MFWNNLQVTYKRKDRDYNLKKNQNNSDSHTCTLILGLRKKTVTQAVKVSDLEKYIM